MFTQEQVQDLYKSYDDPVYWARNFVKVIHPSQGVININLYEYQKNTLRDIFIDKKSVALDTARQIGGSTLVAISALYAALFGIKRYTAVVSHNKMAAEEINRKIQTIYEHLPDHMKLQVLVWNKSTIEFENGARIYFGSVNSPSGFRGRSLSFLICDTLPFTDEKVMAEFFYNIVPCIDTKKNGSILAVSSYRPSIAYNRFCRSLDKYESVPFTELLDQNDGYVLSVLKARKFLDDEQWIREYECH